MTVETQNTIEQNTQDLKDVMSNSLSTLTDDDAKFVEGLFQDNEKIDFFSQILADDLKETRGDRYQINVTEYSDSEELIIGKIIEKMNVSKYVKNNDKTGASKEYTTRLDKKIFSNDTLSIILADITAYPNFAKQIPVNIAENASKSIDETLQGSMENIILSTITDNVFDLETLPVSEQQNIIKSLRPPNTGDGLGDEDKPDKENSSTTPTTEEGASDNTHDTDPDVKSDDLPDDDSKDKVDDEDNKESGVINSEHTITEAKTYIITCIQATKGNDLSNLALLTKVKFTSPEGQQFGSRISSLLCINTYNTILNAPAYQQEQAGNMIVTASVGTSKFLSSVKNYLGYYSKMEQNTESADFFSSETDVLYQKLQGVFTREWNDFTFDTKTANNNVESGNNAVLALKYLKKIEKKQGKTSTLGEKELTDYIKQIDTKDFITAEQIQSLTAQLAIAKDITKYTTEEQKTIVETKINAIIGDIFPILTTMSIEDQVSCYMAFDDLYAEDDAPSDEDDENTEKTGKSRRDKEYDDPDINAMAKSVKEQINKLKAGEITGDELEARSAKFQQENETTYNKWKALQDEEQIQKDKKKEAKQSLTMQSRKSSLVRNLAISKNFSLLKMIDPKNPLIPLESKDEEDEISPGGNNLLENDSNENTNEAPDINTIVKVLQSKPSKELSEADINDFLMYSQEDFQSKFITYNDQRTYLINIMKYTFTQGSLIKTTTKENILGQIALLIKISDEKNAYYIDYLGSDISYYLNYLKSPKNATKKTTQSSTTLYNNTNHYTPDDNTEKQGEHIVENEVNIETNTLTYTPFPNPVSRTGTLNIDVGANKDNLGSPNFDRYVIYNILGQEVKKGNVPYEDNSNQLKISLSDELPDVSSGAYIINLYNSGNPNISLRNTAMGVQKFIIN